VPGALETPNGLGHNGGRGAPATAKDNNDFSAGVCPSVGGVAREPAGVGHSIQAIAEDYLRPPALPSVAIAIAACPSLLRLPPHIQPTVRVLFRAKAERTPAIAEKSHPMEFDNPSIAVRSAGNMVKS
jgi:hypothetical protein